MIINKQSFTLNYLKLHVLNHNPHTTKNAD